MPGFQTISCAAPPAGALISDEHPLANVAPRAVVTVGGRERLAGKGKGLSDASLAQRNLLLQGRWHRESWRSRGKSKHFRWPTESAGALNATCTQAGKRVLEHLRHHLRHHFQHRKWGRCFASYTRSPRAQRVRMEMAGGQGHLACSTCVGKRGQEACSGPEVWPGEGPCPLPGFFLCWDEIQAAGKSRMRSWLLGGEGGASQGSIGHSWGYRGL